jgi:uncharacterized protein involved in exopolysaccharide biosynthesis/Mrp family chromosome partitioning ATPase
MDQPSNDTIDLRDIITLLRRKIRLILLSMFLVTGAALIYLFYATPLYTTTALLLVDPAQKNLLNPDGASQISSGGENARIESEVEILKSDTVKLATIEKLALLSDPEFGASVGFRDKLKMALGFDNGAQTSGSELLNQTLARVSTSTSIRRRGLTYLIGVSASSVSPQRAADLANAMSQTYIELQIQSKVSTALAARDILQAQIDSARGSLAASEDALDFYIDRNLERLSAEADNPELIQIRRALDATNSSRLAAETRARASQDALANRNWEQLAQSLENDAIAALAAQRQEIATRLGQVSQGSAQDIDLRAQLAQLDEGLKTQAQSVIGGLKSDISKLESDAQAHKSGIRQSVLQGDLSSNTLANIYEMQQESEIAQQQYTTLLLRARELQAQALVQIADSRIVSEALPPRKASFPNKKLVLVLGLVASLGIGIGLAFLSEYYVGGVTSVTQLANVLPIPVATSVPHLERGKNQLTVADNVIDAPLSSYAESLRRLRATIDMSLPNTATGDTAPQGKVIMVTSAIPAEGKSTLALALARTYAMAGKSTLLLDTDLRKPSLHKYLGLTPAHGFMEYLRDSGTQLGGESFYDSDPRSSVGVFLGRHRANVPTDQLLQSTLFEELIENARNAMDVVILDTSPLIPVVDARYVAAKADIVVDCVRFGVTSQSDLRLALSQLSASVRPGTPILSALNHDESKVSGYRYDGYYNDYVVE